MGQPPDWEELQPGVAPFGQAYLARKVVQHLLRSAEDRGSAFVLLREANAESDGLYLPLVLLGWCRGSDSFLEPPSGETTEELKDILLRRLRTWASDGTLENHPQLANVLEHWRRYEPDEEERWVLEHMASGARVEAILRQIDHVRPIPKSSSFERIIDLSDLDRVVDRHALAQRLQALGLLGDDSEHSAPIASFWEAYRLRKREYYADDYEADMESRSFALRLEASGRSIACTFDSSLESKVVELQHQRVVVRGWATRNSGPPFQRMMHVVDIRPADEDGAPSVHYREEQTTEGNDNQ